MIIGRELTDKILEKVANRPCVIITDSNVFELYGGGFSKLPVLSFKAGEASKTRETKEKLEDELLKMGCGRDTLLIALGGGVVTDLVGFIASTYMRGISYISVPTTLMGMVDAAIGGKTGVNTRAGKNLIGTFYQPEEIFIDLDYLETLPLKERNEGLTEVIKYGLIRDRRLFELVESSGNLEEMIRRSFKIKMGIVDKDAKEKGLRQVLNFGHTVGHAIEHLSGYAMSHGDAVFLGLLVESRISFEMGLLSEGELNRIFNLREPISFPNFSFEKIWEAMKIDKKNLKQAPHFVLIEEIGKVYENKSTFSFPIEKELVEKSFNLCRINSALL